MNNYNDMNIIPFQKRINLTNRHLYSNNLIYERKYIHRKMSLGNNHKKKEEKKINFVNNDNEEKKIL